MKYNIKKYIVLFAVALLGFTSCEQWLDKYPQSKMTPETYFKSATELQLFTNSFYNNLLPKEPYDEQSDQFIKANPSNVMRGGTNRQVPNSGGGWSWTDLRKLNTALAYMETNTKDETAKQQYSAVCRFFRAYIYFDKVMRFGDVPWSDYELPSNDTTVLYGPRASREAIMQNIIADIDYAAEYLPSSYPNGLRYRVTKWVALALKARFCLFEGTFRKYHDDYASMCGVNWDTSEWKDWKWYLEQSYQAAETIINDGPFKLYSTGNPELDYAVLFSEYDANKDEYMLSINFDFGLELMHNATASALMNSQGRISLTKKFVNAYLMKDGTRFTDKPGWETMQFAEEVKDRDPRLGQTIRIPGYSRLALDGTTYKYSGAKEGIDMNITLTGYQMAKFVMEKNNAANDKFDRSYNDLPVFRFGEVLLNYAEAKAELGSLTQADLDKSINKLRDRVAMPHMDMAAANANPDPYLSSAEWGYTNVSGANKGVILEIRRERAVELAQEGFRYGDLMRWKCGHCIDQQKWLGCYFPGKGAYDIDGDGKNDICIYGKEDPKPAASTATYLRLLGTDIFLSEGEKGYIEPHQNILISFDENRDYLYPVPIDDRSLNPKLTQNRGWNDGLSY
ncbi:MAG: RagB/SusD family nutrient uptake outer membrane protein [Bacteroidales bacterium]|nr:RagB/SusD family nutrient uptake outer membrane protein [Bacteroidales bacterium]